MKKGFNCPKIRPGISKKDRKMNKSHNSLMNERPSFIIEPDRSSEDLIK